VADLTLAQKFAAAVDEGLQQGFEDADTCAPAFDLTFADLKQLAALLTFRDAMEGKWDRLQEELQMAIGYGSTLTGNRDEVLAEIAASVAAHQK
jgi:hypothetical protein